MILDRKKSCFGQHLLDAWVFVSRCCFNSCSAFWQLILVNLSKDHPTSLNEVPVQDTSVIAHNDIFSVADRLFRVEFPYGSPSRVLQPVSYVWLNINKNLLGW